MSDGEIAYLALAIGAFVVYIGLLVYGMAVASERPAASAAGRPSNSSERTKKAA
jgi:hypothetical protein